MERFRGRDRIIICAILSQIARVQNFAKDVCGQTACSHGWKDVKSLASFCFMTRKVRIQLSLINLLVALCYQSWWTTREEKVMSNRFIPISQIFANNLYLWRKEQPLANLVFWRHEEPKWVVTLSCQRVFLLQQTKCHLLLFVFVSKATSHLFPFVFPQSHGTIKLLDCTLAEKMKCRTKRYNSRKFSLCLEKRAKMFLTSSCPASRESQNGTGLPLKIKFVPW